MSTLYNESILLTKYAPLLNHTVTAFMNKLNPHNRNGVLDADDLRQEVTIAFIGIIRTQGEEALTRNRLTYLHVMWDAVRRAYPLAMSYQAFGKQNRKPMTVEGLEGCSEEEALVQDIESDTITQIMIDQLPEPQRTIVRMKLDVMSQREIAHALGVSDATMTRMFQRLKSSIKTDV
ncbi:MAG: sigma-70 family RNA polymerase sigma factor [Clostridiales bacterium]|nr:sigma-70 family RNA polymerase sigma factor [Clostridiales bacterium]